MKEWKVCSYALAVRLAELGVDQTKSEKIWVTPRTLCGTVTLEVRAGHEHYDHCAAYDGSELGVALGGGWIEVPACERACVGTEAKSRALCLIWLLENDHLSVDDVNRRLADV